MEAEYRSLPFDEAITYFRGKLNLPTRRWTDLQRGEHTRAFVVAGVTREALLTDLRGAVDKAIADGVSLQDFRKGFEQLVEKHGWELRGGVAWRSRVIYDTNVRTAYQAGRYLQMTDPAVLAFRPFWEYRHSGKEHARPLHQSWNGLVLQASDAWWRTHYPPNGWGCGCTVRARSRRDLQKMGKAGPDTAPDDGVKEWTDPRTGEVLDVPKGIDPGWDYNVGRSAWGEGMQRQAVAEAAGSSWKRVTPGDWRTHNLPELPQRVELEQQAGPRLETPAERKAAVRAQLGADDALFMLKAGRARLPVLVNAAVTADQVDEAASSLLPMLQATLESPAEVWLRFEESSRGQMAMRYVALLRARLASGEERVSIIEASRGLLERWQLFELAQVGELDAYRAGRILLGGK